MALLQLDDRFVYLHVVPLFDKNPGDLAVDAGDVLTTPLLRGLEMPLARIFAA